MNKQRVLYSNRPTVTKVTVLLLLAKKSLLRPAEFLWETGPGPRRAVLARPRRTHADPEIQQGQLQRTTAQHRPWPGRPVPAGRPDCTSRFFPAMGNEYSSCLGCCGNDSDDTRLLKKGLSSHSDNVPNGVHTWSDAASRL